MTVEAVPVAAGASVPGGRTNAYLVDGAEPLLVDPARRTPALDEAVAARGVAHVAVTHTHPDHVGAVAGYGREAGVTVWARGGREAGFERATGVAPDRVFGEGTAVGPATVIETPGHASDHVAFATGDVAVTGDVAFAAGSVAIGRTGDVRAYLTTLRRLRTRGFSRLYPGHGPLVEDPAATLERLLRHRLDRERRVLEAVEAGAESVEAVVDRAYEKDVGEAYDLAALTVEAHLRKLAVEGRIDWDGRRARPR